MEVPLQTWVISGRSGVSQTGGGTNPWVWVETYYLESVISGSGATLPDRVLKLRTSSFDTGFTLEMKLTNSAIHKGRRTERSLSHGPKYTVQSNEYTIARYSTVPEVSRPWDTEQWTSAREQPGVAQS